MLQALSKARSERADRFERAVKPLLPGLRATSVRLTRNRSEAEDLLQETVLRAWRFWDDFEHGTNLRAWIHRILRNTFVNRYHRARRELAGLAQLRVAGDSDDRGSYEPEALRMALSEEMTSGLAALPAHLHAVLWAVAVDELSYREAAESVGCPIGTIMSRLHRARGALRRSLEGGVRLECA